MKATETKSILEQFTVTGLDIIYSRVSTDEQAGENKTSQDEQIEKSKDYLTRLGLTNWMVFKEDHSGFEYNRPELDKIKELIMQGKVRSLTFWRVDRISRKSGHMDQLREGYFMPFNVEVHSPFDLGKWLWTPSHVHMQNSLVNFAEYWGRMLSQVMMDGRIGLVKKGNTMTFGQAPLGYTEVKDEKRAYFVINQAEADIVLLVFKLFVEGGMSLRQIAVKLDNDRVPTFTELRGGTKLRKSIGKWRCSTIYQILKNTTYDGTWVFGRGKNIKVFDPKTKRMTTKRVKTNEGLIQVPVERIVPHYLFIEAQAKMERNKKQRAGNPAKYPYLMQRRMTCTCGYKMGSEQRNNSRNLYYTCLCRIADYSKKSCSPAYINTQPVDEKAWNWLYSILTNRELIKSKIENYLIENEKAVKPLKDRLAIIDRTLERKHKEHDSIISSYLKLPELAQAKVLANLEELEVRIKEDEQERHELQQQIEQMGISAMAIENFRATYQDIDSPFSIGLNEGGNVKWYTNSEAHEGANCAGLSKITQPQEPMIFEEKRRYIEQFDVQGRLIKEDGKLWLHLTCALDEETLIELFNTLSLNGHFPQSFRLTFSDKLLLDA